MTWTSKPAPRSTRSGTIRLSTTTSGRAPRPRGTTESSRSSREVSVTWPRASPRVSSPSLSRTIRWAASAGREAWASRNAAATSVWWMPGSVSTTWKSGLSLTSRSTYASAPKATTPARSPSCMASSDSCTKATEVLRESSDTLAERSRTNTTPRSSTSLP